MVVELTFRDTLLGKNIKVHKASSESVSVSQENDENNNVDKLAPQEEVLKAETLQALKVVRSNYSFASTVDDGDHFTLMFPDSEIAKKYSMSKTKVNYVIKYGLSPHVKELYINDFEGTPFVFKFDETTTIQTKKQYDGYVQYWSTEQNLITTVYCGSLFVSHCTAKDLMQHFNKFGQEMKWNADLLLQIGMDGPSVNQPWIVWFSSHTMLSEKV